MHCWTMEDAIVNYITFLSPDLISLILVIINYLVNVVSFSAGTLTSTMPLKYQSKWFW